MRREDMKKIEDLFVVKSAESEAKTEDKKCGCEHVYNKVFLDDDVIHCSQRLIFHCAYCNHETIIPIERGLMNIF